LKPGTVLDTMVKSIDFEYRVRVRVGIRDENGDGDGLELCFTV